MTMASIPNPFYLRTGWLIDGAGGPIRTSQTIGIQKDEIISVSDTHASLAEPNHIFDYSNYTILPCLVDCHAHMTWSGTDDPDIRNAQVDWSYDNAHEMILQNITLLKRYGVIGVREGGDRNGHTLRFKMNHLPLDFILHTPGSAFFKIGRYGRIIGQGVGTDIDLKTAVSALKKPLGHIKMVNSGLNSLKEFGKQTASQFDPEALEQTFQMAKAKHFKIMVHANGMLPVKQSVMAGCDSIEHGFFMGRDNLNLMAELGVTWVPTAITMKAYSKYLDSGSREALIAGKNLDHQLEQIAYAKKIGCVLATGTDAGSLGVFHGRSLIEEIQLLMHAGYSIQEAIKSASYNGFQLMGIERQGLIKPGYKASFIMVKADPEKLPQALFHIEKIMLNGHWIDVFRKQ